MKDRTQAGDGCKVRAQGWYIESSYRVTQRGLSEFVLRGAGARDRRFQVSRRVGRTLEHRLEDKKLVQPSRGGGEAHCSGREQGQHRDTRRRRENKGNTEIQGGGEKLCLPNARDSTAFAEPRGEGVSWALQENRGGSELGVERDQRRLEKQVGGPRSSLA